MHNWKLIGPNMFVFIFVLFSKFAMRQVEIQKNTRPPTKFTHHLTISLKYLGSHFLQPQYK